MPSVIRLRTKPGRTYPDMHAAGAQRLGEPGVERVQTGLGGAVHEVRPPRAFGGHRGQRHDATVPLRLQPLRQQHTHRDRADVVGLGQRHGDVNLGPRLLLITEQAEGHDGDVGTGEALRDGRGMARGVAGVEVHDVDGAALVLQRLPGRVAPRRRAGGQDHPQRPALRIRGGGGQRDLGRIAEQQQGLGVT